MKVEGTGPSPSPESAGFDHVAFELPDQRAFAEAFLHLSKSGVEVTPIDNGISWAMYLADPDGNRIELFCDNRAVPGGRLMWGGISDDLDVEVIQADAESVSIAGIECERTLHRITLGETRMSIQVCLGKDGTIRQPSRA